MLQYGADCQYSCYAKVWKNFGVWFRVWQIFLFVTISKLSLGSTVFPVQWATSGVWLTTQLYIGLVLRVKEDWSYASTRLYATAVTKLLRYMYAELYTDS